MARRSLIRVVALTGGIMLALAGCSDTSDPAPATSPTAPSSAAVTPSATASPSPTELTDEQLLDLIPEAARSEDFAGATAFAVFFFEEYGDIYQGASPRLFALMSDEACDFCNRTVTDLTTLSAEGGTTSGGQVKIDQADLGGGQLENGNWNVSLSIHIDALTYLRPDGSVLNQVEAFDGRTAVELIYVDGTFHVVGVGAVPAS